jgi:hypothetical protein
VAHGLADIDWAQPWLAPWRDQGQAVAQRVAQGQTVWQALNAQASPSVRVRFVSEQALLAGLGYEAFIASNGQCPTRDGAHDFFNGLAWLHFPRTKAHLNDLHLVQLAHASAVPGRGAARDALTLFDENAALLSAPEALWQALWRKDWVQVFGELRPLWAQAELTLFGHALLEKLLQPRKAITAHVYRVPESVRGVRALDDWLASHVQAEDLARKPFAHLPVLGVPAWWPGNEDTAFYQDASVFRAPRLRSKPV